MGQFRVAVRNVQGIVMQSSKDLLEREGVIEGHLAMLSTILHNQFNVPMYLSTA